MITRFLLLLIAISVVEMSPDLSRAEDAAPIQIDIDPHCMRQVRGVSALDRNRYFVLGDAGQDFEQRCNAIGEDTYQHLIHDLRIRFGRGLGPVESVIKYTKLVEEDPKRPGHANLEKLQEGLPKTAYQPSDRFRRDLDKLDVASHGNHNAYPEFMGKFIREQALKDKYSETLPWNIDAAAELAATVLRYAYTDFDRPAYFEPLNEPHWAYHHEQHLADWHLKTMAAVHRLTPKVKVGGLCMSVAYLYRNGYHTFNRGFKPFIDNTKCKLDFYSFHAYDYHNWRDGDFEGGSIQSGLPMENTLDVINNYTHNWYGKEVKIICSEQGGYIEDDTGGYNGAEIADRIARKHFPGSGFEWEMKKRSILDFNHVSTIIANTMTFMDHPHTVQKTVPFILLDSAAWDPKYYAVLYTPYNYTDKSRMVPSRMVDFYKFFQHLKGNSVKAVCNDPDIQTRAYVDGGKLYIVMNNLWNKHERVSINAPAPKSITVRRYGRKPDFTPYLYDEPLKSLDDFTIGGREALLITADYGEPITLQRTVNEVPCYGDRVAVPLHENNRFVVKVPDAGNLDYAVLRIGLERPLGTDRQIQVTLNGHPLHVPLEDCHPRLEEPRHGYATCKFVVLEPGKVRKENLITVSFPDGKAGTVGSVVIRAAVKESSNE